MNAAIEAAKDLYANRRTGEWVIDTDEAEVTMGLVREVGRLEDVIAEAYRRVVSLGKHVVVQPNSPRPFPIADLLDLLSAASPGSRSEEDWGK